MDPQEQTVPDALTEEMEQRSIEAQEISWRHMKAADDRFARATRAGSVGEAMEESELTIAWMQQYQRYAE